MSRTIVDFPDEQIQALDRLREMQHVSRASLVRDAVAEYLASHHAELSDEAFGIWRDHPKDALSYEDDLRREWDV